MAEKVVTIDCVNGEITVDPESVRCNQNLNKDDPDNPGQKLAVIDRVRWKATKNVSDWRVIFGAYAPVDRKSKIASPNNDTLSLVSRRPEDLGHWKYVVVAKCEDGKLRDKDPEMIVED